jgi:hypothetical protein
MDYKELLEVYLDYLHKIPNGCMIIAEKLREDKLDVALNSIKDFSEGVLWLSEASELLKKQNMNLTLNISQIEEYLNEINEGLLKQDYILVADMFEYEIEPFFKVLATSKVQ